MNRNVAVAKNEEDYTDFERYVRRNQTLPSYRNMKDEDRKRLYNYIHEGNVDFHDLRNDEVEERENLNDSIAKENRSYYDPRDDYKYRHLDGKESNKFLSEKEERKWQRQNKKRDLN